MSLVNFRRILDKIPGSVRLLNLWHRGEPLAAPDLPEMIASASRRGIKTQTHSNGILLSKKEFSSRLVEAKLTRITVAIDGPDQETYQRYRTGGRLHDIEKGIKSLHEARSKAGVKHPEIFVECLLSRQTPAQFHEISKLAKEWGADKVRFKTFRVSDIYNFSKSREHLPSDPELWRYKQTNGHLTVKKIHPFCLRLSWSATITWDGSALPCCFDSDASHILGNIFDQDWKSIWRGDKFKRFRKRVMMSKNGRPAMCDNCTEGLPGLYLPAPEFSRVEQVKESPSNK